MGQGGQGCRRKSGCMSGLSDSDPALNTTLQGTAE